MKNIKSVLTNYILRHRFLFEDVYTPLQVKLELISTLLEISMFINSGMKMKEIDYVINKLWDLTVTDLGTSVNFILLINYIKRYKTTKGLNGYKLAIKLIDHIFNNILGIKK